MKCKCPLCDGTGEIDRMDPVVERKKMRAKERVLAAKLRTEGYSLRKIAEILGYNNPMSISKLLKQK